MLFDTVLKQLSLGFDGGSENLARPSNHFRSC